MIVEQSVMIRCDNGRCREHAGLDKGIRHRSKLSVKREGRLTALPSIGKHLRSSRPQSVASSLRRTPTYRCVYLGLRVSLTP